METGIQRCLHPNAEQRCGQARTMNSSRQLRGEIAQTRCASAHIGDKYRRVPGFLSVTELLRIARLFVHRVAVHHVSSQASRPIPASRNPQAGHPVPAPLAAGDTRYLRRQSNSMYQPARSARPGKCRRYVCLRTDRRRIRTYAVAMLANRPARGNHETQRITQPEITRPSDRLA